MQDHTQDTGTTVNLRFAASQLLDSGCSVIPIRDLASKAPGLQTWKPFQAAAADRATADHWFTANGPPSAPGMAIVCGPVSRGLTVLDFDTQDDEETLYHAWAALVEQLSPGLVERLPLVETPSGG